MIPNRFSKFVAAMIAVVVFVGAKLEAADLSRARVRDNIVYFLEPSPAQLKRYDMAAQAWLSPLPAPAGATCFDIDTNAIYFGTDQSIVRTGLGGGTGTNLATVPAIMEDIVIAGPVLVGVQGPVTQYASRHLASVDKLTGTIRGLQPFSGSTGRMTVSSNSAVIWVHAGDYLVRIAVNGAGTFGALTSRYLGTVKEARSPLLSKEGARLFLNDSTFYNPDDLIVIGQLSQDHRRLAANRSGFLATIGSNVVCISRLGHETGRVTLPFIPGMIQAYGTNAFAFSDNLDQTVAIKLANLGGDDPDGPVDYSAADLMVDSIVSDQQGRVFFIGRKLPMIFGWSAANRTWLPEIPLSGVPKVLAHDSYSNRLLVGLESGWVVQVNLDAPLLIPTPYTLVGRNLLDIGIAGRNVVLSFGPPQAGLFFLQEGVFGGISIQGLQATAFAWDPLAQRIWGRQDSANNFVSFKVSASDSGFSVTSAQYASGPNPFSDPAPTFLSPDGKTLLGLGGTLIGLTGLSETKQLGVATKWASWTTQGLHTIRAVGGYSQLQHWNSALQQTDSAFLEGEPVALFSLGTNLLAVSKIGYELQFSRWTPSLTMIETSPVSSAPTNITFSGGLTNRMTTYAVVGTLGLEPGSSSGEPGFQVQSVSPNESIYAVGSNLVYYGTQFLPSSTNPVLVTVVATNQRGRSITRTISVPVIITPSQRPNVYLERITVSSNAFSGREVQFRLRLDPPPSEQVLLYFDVTGDAKMQSDFFASNLNGPSVQSPPYEATASISPGANEAILFVYPLDGLPAYEPRTLTLRLKDGLGYQAATTNAETVLLWRSPFTAYMAKRFGSANVSQPAAAPDGDIDGDGVSNYADYLFANGPGVAFPRIGPSPDPNGQAMVAVRFRRSLPVAGQFDLLVSTNLTDWSPGNFVESLVPLPDGDTEEITWRFPRAGRPTLFARVRGAAPGVLRYPDRSVPGIGIDIVGLPQVGISIGSDTYEWGSLPDERPRFVTSFGRSFWVSKREISQSEYVALMTNNPSVNVGTNLPVENVSWNEAAEFCRRLTEREAAAGRLPDGYVFRLPTEAEWEYSARGGGYWPWGSIDRTNLTVSAWFAPNSFYVTHPVGRLAPNAYGLQDMLGNVAEWCADWYGPYPSGTVIDRVGPLFGTQRVIRGGSILDSETGIRAAARSSAPPEFRSRLVGFRVVLARPVQ